MKINLQDIKLEVLEDKITLTGSYNTDSYDNIKSLYNLLEHVETFIRDIGYLCKYDVNSKTYVFTVKISGSDRESRISLFQERWNKAVEANKYLQNGEELMTASSAGCKIDGDGEDYDDYDDSLDLSLNLLPTGRLRITAEKGDDCVWSTSRDLTNIIDEMSIDAVKYINKLSAERLAKES